MDIFTGNFIHWTLIHGSLSLFVTRKVSKRWIKIRVLVSRARLICVKFIHFFMKQEKKKLILKTHEFHLYWMTALGLNQLKLFR